MKSSDTRKQKEFFEKKRMQNRHNILAPPPAAPKDGNVGNMDLLTMFIVNQIALKKEHASNPKIARLPKSKGSHRSMDGESFELPMSPCSPSRLSLAESESHYSYQALGLKKRKPILLDEFKFKTLSPLLETNLSDNSPSVSQHRVQGSVASFSPASQSSSEAFNLQSRPKVNISHSPTTELHCRQTALPVGLYECSPWTEPYQSFQTSFPDGVQLESTLNRSDSSGPSIHSAENPFNDLVMNDQEKKRQLNNGTEDGFGKRTAKFHPQKEAPHLPTGYHEFIESYNNVHSIDLLSQHMSRCVDDRFGRNVLEHAWESPVTRSHRAGDVILDNATNSIPSLSYSLENGLKQDSDSFKYVCYSKGIPTSQNLPSETSAPPRDMCNHKERRGKSELHGVLKTLRQINYNFKQNSEEDQFVPSCLLTKTQSVKMHKKASSKTQDMATQTAGFSSQTSQDASVQCCLFKTARMHTFTRPTNHVHHSKTHKASATRGQTLHSSKNAHPNQFAVSEIPKVERNTSCMMVKQEPTKHGPETIIRHERLSKSESQSCRKNRPLPHFSHTNAQENIVLRGERCEGHEESVTQNPTVNFSCTEEHNNTVTAETGGHGESEGKLKEIADILLMLKQKK